MHTPDAPRPDTPEASTASSPTPRPGPPGSPRRPSATGSPLGVVPGRRGRVPAAGVPVTWQSVLLADVLAAGPAAVASHRSAAVLWGLDGVRRGAPELTSGRDRHYVARRACGCIAAPTWGW